MSHSHFVIESLPFSTRLCSKHAKDILARDRSRAQKLLSGLHPLGPQAFRMRGLNEYAKDGDAMQQSFSSTAKSPKAAPNSVDVTDAGVTYTMEVGVGNPPTNCTLLIDTGSSNTWVGADKKYKPTSTSKDTRKSVKVGYGSGQFTGTEYTDQVTLGPKIVIKNQSIGVANTAQGFNGVDGILGIGPVDLTEGTVSGTSSVPTVLDNLFKQGTIKTESIGISYVPATDSGSLVNGELTFGGTDSSKFSSSIGYVPITSTEPANRYWGIDQTLSYGGRTIQQTTAGIVDTGTTLLLLATDAFQAYQKATGGVMDQSTGLLTISEEQYSNLQSLVFTIGDNTYELTPNAQIWPRAANSTIGGEEGKIYLVTADLGNIGGQGLDFIDGFVFLQRFYSVYDVTNNRVGLAPTQFTNAESN